MDSLIRFSVSSSLPPPLQTLPKGGVGTTTLEERWRIFCAIQFPDDVAEKAHEHINSLRRQFPNATASWSRSFHLTLKFIGWIDRSKVGEISSAASQATSGLGNFEIVVDGAGAFPNRGAARVLWLGIEDASGRLSKLQHRLDDECGKIGLAKEDRPFHPHLTIARLRQQQAAREITTAHKELGFNGAKVEVRELLVIRSELSNKGSRYTTVSRHPLA